MDVPLRCNNREKEYCRNELSKEATITTCSHVFCKECIERLEFHHIPRDKRKCPACDIGLPQIDDIRTVNLRPSEEFKNIILAGLDPSTIIECTLRGIQFWNYQMNSEIAWQQHLAKAMTEKYSSLNARTNHIISEANNEIVSLRDKIRELQLEKDHADKQNEMISFTCREKIKRCQTLQTMYDTLKKRVQDDQTRDLAAASAEHTLRTIGAMPPPEISTESSQKNTPTTTTSKRPAGHDLTSLDTLGGDQFYLRTHSGATPRPQTSSEVGLMMPPSRPPEKESIRRFNTNSTPAHRIPPGRLSAERHAFQHPDLQASASRHLRYGSVDQSLLSQDRHKLQSPHFHRVSTALSPQIHRGIKSSKPLY